MGRFNILNATFNKHKDTYQRGDIELSNLCLSLTTYNRYFNQILTKQYF